MHVRITITLVIDMFELRNALFNLRGKNPSQPPLREGRRYALFLYPLLTKEGLGEVLPHPCAIRARRHENDRVPKTRTREREQQSQAPARASSTALPKTLSRLE